VHGPADLTFEQIAGIVGAVTGRDVQVRIDTDEQTSAALRSVGLSERAVAGIVGMTSGLREHVTPEQPRSLLTTTPTTLGAWAYEYLRPAL
jgi:hypothetical protein